MYVYTHKNLVWIKVVMTTNLPLLFILVLFKNNGEAYDDSFSLSFKCSYFFGFV